MAVLLGLLDSRNADFVEYVLTCTAGNGRYDILGSADKVNWETLIAAVNIAAGATNFERLTRDQTTHRFFRFTAYCLNSPFTISAVAYAKGRS